MKRFALFLACLGSLAPILMATSITYVGMETGSVVQNWSNPAVTKTQDINGDNRYGDAGYYQISPGSVEGGVWSQVVGDGNNLGITALYPTQYASPTFLNGNAAGGEGTLLNIDYFPLFYDPTGATQSQQGVLRLSSEAKVSGNVPGNATGMRNKAFTFTMSNPAVFRLGVAVDTLTDGSYGPDYVSVTNANTGEVFSAAIVRDGVPDMVFFDIGGNVGDVFEVGLWQTDENGTDGGVAFALVSFDLAPTPTLAWTKNSGSITLSWEPERIGWILESSTDLGVGDTWDPVPGVVNNSVTVPTIGVPQNFFRLKLSP